MFYCTDDHFYGYCIIRLLSNGAKNGSLFLSLIFVIFSFFFVLYLFILFYVAHASQPTLIIPNEWAESHTHTHITCYTLFSTYTSYTHICCCCCSIYIKSNIHSDTIFKYGAYFLFARREKKMATKIPHTLTHTQTGTVTDTMQKWLLTQFSRFRFFLLLAFRSSPKIEINSNIWGLLKMNGTTMTGSIKATHHSLQSPWIWFGRLGL